LGNAQTIINDKLRPFANKKMVEYLGLQDDEMVDAIIKHVEGRKGAQELVDELEPVLAEEAEEFTIKFCASPFSAPPLSLARFCGLRIADRGLLMRDGGL